MAKKNKASKLGVTYKKTFVGMKIIDKEGTEGVIIDREDIHNVYIKYPNGWGFYCLDETCQEYETFFEVK